MRPYEFKTNAIQQSRPFSTFNSLSQKDTNLLSSHSTHSDYREFDVKDTHPSQVGSSFSGSNNIIDMKSRLDQLLKQTEMLSTDKKPCSSKDKAFDLQNHLGGNRFNGNGPIKINLQESRSEALLGGHGVNDIGSRYKKQQVRMNLNNSDSLQQINLSSVKKHSSSQSNHSQTKMNGIPKSARPQTNYNLQVSSPKNKLQFNNISNDIRPICNIPEGNRQNLLMKDKSRANFDNFFKTETKISEGLKDFPSFNLNLSLQKLSEKIPSSVSKYTLQPSLIAAKRNQSSSTFESTNLASKIKQTSQKTQIKKDQPFQKPLTSSRSSEKSRETKDNEYICEPNICQKLKKEQVKRVQVPDNLLQCQIKLRVFDQDCRKFRQELAEMAEGKQYYRKELSQSWRNNKKLKDQYEQKIVEMKKTHMDEIQKLDDIIRKKDINITQLINELVQAKSTSILSCYDEKANKILSQNTQMIKIQAEKQKQMTEIKASLVGKDIIIEDLTEKVSEMENQIKQLSNFKNQTLLSKAQSFNDMLKMQLKSISQFKQLVFKLNEKNKVLRQRIIESESKNERLANQNKILQLNFKSKLNNTLIEHAIQQTNKENTINNLKQRLTAIQQRHKLAVNEIKNKDQFFRQHLIGCTDKKESREYIESVLLKYKQEFIPEQLKMQLDKAHKKIALYEKYS